MPCEFVSTLGKEVVGMCLSRRSTNVYEMPVICWQKVQWGGFSWMVHSITVSSCSRLLGETDE